MFKKSSDQGYVHRSPTEEFEEFTNNELQRLHHSDADFDEALYKKAVELVLARLKDAGER